MARKKYIKYLNVNPPLSLENTCVRHSHLFIIIGAYLIRCSIRFSNRSFFSVRIQLYVYKYFVQDDNRAYNMNAVM